MKKTLRASTLALAFGLSALFLPAGDAQAAGLEMDSSALSAATRSGLEQQIEQARGEVPLLFKAVGDIVRDAAAIDARARARGIPFTAQLKALGPRALMPMLEVVAFEAKIAKDVPASARAALRVGLLEAIGSIRDDRAVPVLTHVMTQSRDAKIAQASVTALSRIGTDAAMTSVSHFATTLHQAEPGGAREQAVLAGLHDCHREVAAHILVARYDAGADEATARIIVKSLGGVANAWAWRALGNGPEYAATRSTAAEALVRAFVERPGAVRDAAAKAILVVDDPQTPTLLKKAAAGAGEDTVRAIDELARRFAANPTRL